ncbi:MAG: hypothetical protein ACYDEV_12115 [Acidiferrobacter sp.]
MTATDCANLGLFWLGHARLILIVAPYGEGRLDRRAHVYRSRDPYGLRRDYVRGRLCRVRGRASSDISALGTDGPAFVAALLFAVLFGGVLDLLPEVTMTRYLYRR